jgi:hypothetical protein
MRACCEVTAPRSIGRKASTLTNRSRYQERAMTIHQYLVQACKDDAQRAGERDRVLLEARRVGLIRRPGAGLAALFMRGVRLLSRWTSPEQNRLAKQPRSAAEVQPTAGLEVQPTPD